MLKVRTEKLRSGMVTAAPVMDPKAHDGLPLLSEGVELVEGYILRLLKHGVEFVYVEIPEGYTGKSGENIEVERLKRDIVFKGRLSVVGNVPAGINVEAGERLAIMGDIEKGSTIACREGSIVIRGSAFGTADEPTTISIAQNVIFQNARYLDVKAGGVIRATGTVSNSTLTTGSSVRIEGPVSSTRINAQGLVHLSAAHSQGGPVHATVRPREVQALLQEIIRTDARLGEIATEKERLTTGIEAVRKLTGSLTDLPPEKRAAIAEDVKRYKALDQEAAALSARKDAVVDENRRILSRTWVAVPGFIAKGTRITILNSTYEVPIDTRHKAFSVRDFNIFMSEYSAA